MPSSSSVSVPASLEEGCLRPDADPEAAADIEDEAMEELDPFDCSTPSRDDGSTPIEVIEAESSEVADSIGPTASDEPDDEESLCSVLSFSNFGFDSEGALREISQRASII